MMNFLKSFFSNEKSPEEQSLQSTMDKARERDVLMIDGYEEPQGCGTKRGGCGGCGCG